jgi:uncharacterized protein
MSKTPITVVHRPEGQTFEAFVDGLRCMADYQREGQVIHMTHTVVPPALEGQGIAAQLVEAALKWAQAEHLKVNPVCSYVRIYLQRRPEWQALMV